MIGETKGQKKIFRLKHRRQKNGKYWAGAGSSGKRVFQENVWSPRRRRKKEQFKRNFEEVMVLNFAALKEDI